MRQLIALFALVAVVFATKGVVELDEKTFDRVVSNSKLNFLVAFLEFSWKDPDNYGTLVDQVGDVIIAKVDTSTSEELKKRYSITSYPTFLFLRGGDLENPSQLKGIEKPSAEELVDFIRTEQTPSLIELKTLAKNFASSNSKESDIKRATEIVGGLIEKSAKEHAQYFVTVMKKVVEKGNEFIGNERQRLDKLITDKSTKAEKKTDFSRKANVLNHFGANNIQ